MLKPPFILRPVAVTEDLPEERRQLIAFYNEIKEQANSIPYKLVPDGISRKVSRYLTHPTTLESDNKRWIDVVVSMGTSDLCSLGELNFHGGNDMPPFFKFLKDKYGQPDGSNTLWGLINALLQNDCTDVLSRVKKDISDFLEEYRSNALSIKQESEMPSNACDSGFGDQSVSSERSYSFRHESMNMQLNDKPPSLSSENRSFTTICGTSHNQFLSNNNNCLIGPLNDYLILDRKGNQIEKETADLAMPSENLKDHPDSLNVDWSDLPEFDLDFLACKEALTKSKGIRVFIPHTQNEEDIKIAEEIAKELRELPDFHIETYLLNNLSAWIANLGVPDFALLIMEMMDFLVPLISHNYLEEIKLGGDPDDMSSDRLGVRYFHVAAQNRVLNKNCLNYLIRPIVINGVRPGVVRKWPEFQCAYQYPRDLRRLAKNLCDSKKIIQRKRAIFM